MATMITDECINCGACEPECPNTAIYQGGVEYDWQDGKLAPLSNEIFYIVPEKCTECVGFFDHEACAAVCPVDCCIPNPNIPESEDLLIQRARELHPDKTFEAGFPSRFSKEAAGGNGAAAPVASAAAAPATTAAPVAAAASVAAAGPAVVMRFGKVEKKVTPLKQPDARREPYTGELAFSFDEALEVVSPEAAPGLGSNTMRVLIALAQPLLGALPAGVKARLEAAINDRRVFSSAGSTGMNVLVHLIALPVLATAYAVLVRGDSPYTEAVRPFFFWGAVAASLEAMFRMREAVFQAKPASEVVYRGAVYGPLLLPLVAPLLKRVEATRSEGTVASEGYYGGGSGSSFDEKRERERRYGEIYTFEERPSGYLLRLELPRFIPPSGVKEELGLGNEMPDYELDLSLGTGTFQVHGKVVDPRLRTIAATAPAFPPDFTTRVPLGERCAGFAHRYQNKVLEVVLIKASAANRLTHSADAA